MSLDDCQRMLGSHGPLETRRCERKPRLATKKYY